jgi:hypothetical protein
LVEVTGDDPLKKLVWANKKDPKMKGIRYSTEQKILILHEAEVSGKTNEDVCRH